MSDGVLLTRRKAAQGALAELKALANIIQSSIQQIEEGAITNLLLSHLRI